MPGGSPSQSPETPRVGALKICLVDDQDLIRGELRELLTGWGHEVVDYDHAMPALAYLAEHPEIDLLLTDWVMPETSGIELCRTARELKRATRLNILILTSRSQVEDKVEALDAGADSFLSKPVDPLELRAQLGVISRKVQLKKDLVRRIEELTQARAEAERAQAEAERAMDVRQNFLAQMSHELRTPMHGVLGTFEVLRRTGLSVEQEQLVTLAETSSQNLLRILNDILDLCRMDSGKMEIVARPFKLSQVVYDALAPLRFLAVKKGLGFSCQILDDVPEAVVGDSGRLAQILVNLVGNALKFTEQGQISLSVQRTALQECERIQFQVSDTGVGIPQELLDKIFLPFHQVGRAVEGQTTGSGLGLPICKKLAEEMGGELTITSEVGQGTTLFLEVPVQLGDPAQVEAEWSLFRGLSYRCAAPEFEKMVERSLAGHGLEPTDGIPDILFFTSAEQLIQGVSYKILISESLDVQSRSQVLPDAIIHPPVVDFSLQRALQQCLRRKEEPAAASSESGRKLLLAEDNPINRRVLHKALSLEGYSVESVENGREAVELFEQQDFDLVIMDMQMPVMDGLRATRIIREQENRQGRTNTPVIALTAHAVEEVRRRCLEAGMDEVLSKPIATRDLVEVLAKYHQGGPLGQ